MSEAISKQAQIAANILSFYTNRSQLVTETFTVDNFQKSFPESEYLIIPQQVVSEYAKKQIKESSALEKSEKQEAITKANDEIKAFRCIHVFGKNYSNVFYVKKKAEQAAEQK